MRLHMRLHYHVVDPLTMSDTYIILAEPSPADTEDIQLYLNLLEMWGPLQGTPCSMDLLAWLPPGVDCPQAGQHLNTALPLHQSSPTADYIRPGTRSWTLSPTPPCWRSCAKATLLVHSVCLAGPSQLIRPKVTGLLLPGTHNWWLFPASRISQRLIVSPKTFWKAKNSNKQPMAVSDVINCSFSFFFSSTSQSLPSAIQDLLSMQLFFKYLDEWHFRVLRSTSHWYWPNKTPWQQDLVL